MKIELLNRNLFFSGENEDIDEIDVEGEAPPEPEETPKCYAEMTAESGLFTSPKFPEHYPENSNCTWNITAPKGKRIQLTFHVMTVNIYRFLWAFLLLIFLQKNCYFWVLIIITL